MILGIDPKVDYAFKHVFGREATQPPYRFAEQRLESRVRPGDSGAVLWN
jgi:hypothetical protein